MPVQWVTTKRGSSLDLLESAFDSTRQAGAVLVGPAGVGKTVLAREASDRYTLRHPESVTRWVAGTASASVVPFGAFSHLVDVPGTGESASLLRTARASLQRHSSRLLVAVDDAHHLDNLSATLVHQLAVTNSARLVVTVRAGEPTPDAITALWKDSLLARVDIEPFDRAQTVNLLETVLGGPLESASVDGIFRVSQGNPLYLRHLVEGALNAGNLNLVQGVWQLRGEMVLTPQLSTLIGKHLASLPDSVNSVLQYLAVEEPLTLGDLTALTGRDAIEHAESLGAVTVSDRGDDLVVHPAHPLYTECVRASLGRLHIRRLRTALVAQLSTHPAPSVTARLRLAALALDSDNPPTVPEVVTSSYEALRLGDLALGERLSRAALERSGGLAARLPLAHSLAWQGRGRDADGVLAPVDPEYLSEWDLMAWTLPKAANQFWMLGDSEAAIKFLDAMRARISEPAALHTIDALAATFAMNSGDLGRAIAVSADVLKSDAAQDIAVAWAAATATLSHARTGRFAQVDALARRGLAAEHPGLLRFVIGLGEITTALMLGDIDAAEERAKHYREFAELQQPGHAIGEVLLAQVLIIRGDLVTASALARQAAAALTDTGYSWGPLALMSLAQVEGQRGDKAAAAEALQRAEAAHGLKSEVYAPELALARAWTLAAARDVHGAVSAAREGARLATRSGQAAMTLRALGDAVRLGDTRAADLINRAGVECAYSAMILAHARALAAGDGPALDAASARYADAGLIGAAADAAAQAAVAHAARGVRKNEMSAKARAAELARMCGDASTPALDRVLNPLPLTGREREIAIMVADGLTNKAIAETLCVSVRTVEGHIYRACTKLDVSDRTMLGHAVRAARGDK